MKTLPSQTLLYIIKPFPFLSGLFFITLLIFLSTHSVFAADLKSALKSKDKVINFAGKEGDDVRIPKGISVIGKSLSKATINGEVTMGDGAVLKNVTINAKAFGIIVEKGASVVIENVTVKGASDIGIFAEAGTGKMTLRNSRVTNNRKGLYILPGKHIVLTGNEIAKNEEEGLDVWQNVDGAVSNNRFIDNGESGAEIIIGDSGLSFTNNVFSGNKASGLALQFYKEAEKNGRMTIDSNFFAGNSIYGIVCKSPAGGTMPIRFFHNSVKLTSNSFSGNKKGSIDAFCGITNVIPQPEGEEQEEPTEEENDTANESEENAGVEVSEGHLYQTDGSRLKEVRLQELSRAVEDLEREIEQPRSFWQKLWHKLTNADAEYFDAQDSKVEYFEKQVLELSFTSADDQTVVMNDQLLSQITVLLEALDRLAQTIQKQNARSLLSF